MWWEFVDGTGEVFIPKRFGLTANFHLVPEMDTFRRMRRSVELTG